MTRQDTNIPFIASERDKQHKNGTIQAIGRALSLFKKKGERYQSRTVRVARV